MAAAASDKMEVIIRALDSYGDRGCGLISLSLKTGVSQSSLRRFVDKHKKYCLPIDKKHKYKLNKEKGSVEQVLASMATEQANARISNAFGLGLLLGMGMTYIGDFLGYVFYWLF